MKHSSAIKNNEVKKKINNNEVTPYFLTWNEDPWRDAGLKKKK